MTTRQAVLPDGKVLHFPAETPDEAVHAHVRQHMGLPAPEKAPDPVLVAHAQTQQALAHTAGAMEASRQASDRSTMASAALHQKMGENLTALHQHIGALAQAHQAVLAHLAHLSENMKDFAAHSAAAHHEANTRHAETRQSLDKLSAAISKPRRAVKNEDGSWSTSDK